VVLTTNVTQRNATKRNETKPFVDPSIFRRTKDADMMKHAKKLYLTLPPVASTLDSAAAGTSATFSSGALASTSAIAPRNKEKAYTKKKIEIIVASLLLLGLGEPKKKKKSSNPFPPVPLSAAVISQTQH